MIGLMGGLILIALLLWGPVLAQEAPRFPDSSTK